MEQLKKNTVKAENQLKKDEQISFYEGDGIKVMFVGNSITRHGPKEEIGWRYDWGMAASDIEKDYVHILMRRIKERTEAAFCINQAYRWESNYKNTDTVIDEYKVARDFEADIIIARFVENCKADDFDGEAFRTGYAQFIDFLNKSGKAKVIITTSFWSHPADTLIEEFAKERKYPLVTLGDLGELDEMKAIGLFEHSGVAQHPGDLGMKVIADRIWKELQKII